LVEVEDAQLTTLRFITAITRETQLDVHTVSAIKTIHNLEPRQGRLLAFSLYHDMLKWLDMQTAGCQLYSAQASSTYQETSVQIHLQRYLRTFHLIQAPQNASYEL